MKEIKKIDNEDIVFLSNYIFESGYECPLLEVKSFHALNQIIGYAKFINQKEEKILFRGQTSLYKNLLPSLYRSCDTDSAINRRNIKICEIIREAKENLPILKNYDNKIIEPLLQHYGIKTRWIDLVDNLWIALTFCLYEYKTSLNYGNKYEYVKIRDDENEYGYLLLVCSDAFSTTDVSNGLYKGNTTNLVDLRMAAPSVFLRPHSQHALLMQQKGASSLNKADLSNKIAAIIQIQVKNIKKWLGNGKLTSIENIYPPPIYDNGYSLLLDGMERKKIREKEYGSISIISYSI